MKNSILRMIKQLLKIDKQYMFVSLIAIPVGIINPLIDIFFLQLFLESIADDKSVIKALLILLAMFILNLVNLIWDGYASHIYMPTREKRISMIFKLDIIEAVKRSEVRNFDNPDFYDHFVLASQDIDIRCIAIWKSCVNIMSLFASIGTVIALIVTTDPYLIVFAVFSAVIGLIPQLIKVKNDYEYRNQKASLDRQESYIGRIMYDKSFIYDAKCSGIGDVLKNQLRTCTDRNIALIKKYSSKNMLAENIQSIIVVLFTLVTWLYLGIRIIFGYYTIASFASMFNACNSFRNSIKSVVSTITDFKAHKLYADKIYSFLDNDLMENYHIGIHAHFNHICEFRNVNFSYPQNKDLTLKKINFKLKRGEKVAIVGRNGAGKSTLLKLLLRFYEPTAGEILMDDVPYEVMNVSSIRACFACCFQNLSLYSIPLGENIAMSNNYLDKDINSVLQMVNMDKYSCSIKSQVNRDYDDEGLVFSGGETQRIGIARLLYQTGDILIFDEANASLDPIAEKELNDLICEVSGNKTTIFITHRLSTAIKADRILYMENGKIVEEGTHKELMHMNGAYAKLYNTQIEQLEVDL